MASSQTVRQFRRARNLGTAVALCLFAASGCADEVGGDGYQPPHQSPNSGGVDSSGGAGGAEGGAGGEGGALTAGKGGKGGSAGHGGTAGKAGSAGSSGTGIITEGGASGSGGEAPMGPVCGNNIVEMGEECDDGNTKSGDGCTADCKSGCEVCEKTYCKAMHAPVIPSLADFYDDCFELAGPAPTGLAQGVPNKDLCQAIVDCVRTEHCAQFVDADTKDGQLTPYQFVRCFCDRDITEPNYISHCKTPPLDPDKMPPDPADNTFIPGKCARQFLEASYRDTVGEAFNGLTTAQKPLGGANLLLLECDQTLCREECFPEASAGTVAQITADILSTPTDPGETQLGDLIADAQRSAMSTDFAFVNATTFQPTYSYADGATWGFFFKASEGRPADADGRLLESEVTAALLGIEIRNASVNLEGGANLDTMQLTGQQVYDFLNQQLGFVDVSGLTYTWDAALPTGSRVTEVKKGGVAIDKSAGYSVTANDKLAASISGATNLVVSGKNPTKTLVAYLKAQTQPIAPPSLDRVTRLN